MNARILLATVVVLIAVAAPMGVYGEDAKFPLSFRFHCGGKARNSVPRAMGFSPDSKILAIWYMRDMIFVDAGTGKAIRRVKVARELTAHLTPYNFVAFDPSGKFCCIALVSLDGFTLQFIDVERGIASTPASHNGGRHPTLLSCYRSTQGKLPLRQWLAFQEVPKNEANFDPDFSGSDDSQQSQRYFLVAFHGNDRVTKAEQMFEAMDGKQAIEAARNVGEYAGTDMQVALSNDGKTLLTQFIGRGTASTWYRFHFYDAETKESLTEIHLPTGYPYRHGVSRGFAFSPDLRRLVRSVRGGHVIVHDLSSLVDRKLAASATVQIPADYGNVDK